MIPTAAGGMPVGSQYKANPSTPAQQQAYQPSSYNYSSLPSAQQQRASDIFGLLDFSVAGQREANNAAIQNLTNRAGTINAGYGEQAGYMNQNYGNQMGQLRVNADTNMYDQTVVDKLMGTSTAGYNNLLAQFGLQEADARNKSAVQRRAAASDAIARGAYGGAGTGQDFTDISSALANQLGMYGAQREKAGIDYKTETINLEKRKNDLTQQGKIYGLQGEQFGIALQQGLAKLRLDNTLSVGNLMDSVNSKTAANAALAASVIQQALAASGYVP